jgi:hypothetical protein
MEAAWASRSRSSLASSRQATKYSPVRTTVIRSIPTSACQSAQVKPVSTDPSAGTGNRLYVVFIQTLDSCVFRLAIARFFASIFRLWFGVWKQFCPVLPVCVIDFNSEISGTFVFYGKVRKKPVSIAFRKYVAQYVKLVVSHHFHFLSFRVLGNRYNNRPCATIATWSALHRGSGASG